MDKSASCPFLDRPDEEQVFVDATGRRERLVRRGLVLAVALSSLWLGGLAVGSVGFQSMPAVGSPAGPAATPAALQAHAPHARPTTDVDRVAVATHPRLGGSTVAAVLLRPVTLLRHPSRT